MCVVSFKDPSRNEIKEFKKIRAKEENIKVKLVGFKKEYELENTGEEMKHVFVEHK